MGLVADKGGVTTETPVAGIYAALAALRAEAPKLRKTATNPHFRSRYTPLEDIKDAVDPLLRQHGLVWVTAPDVNDHGPVLGYALVHPSSGEEIRGEMALMLSKQDPQAQGSAITYARRYALVAVLDLIADEDDDGNASSPPPKTEMISGDELIEQAKAQGAREVTRRAGQAGGGARLATEKQRKFLFAKAKAAGVELQPILESVAGVESLDALPGRLVDAIRDAIAKAG